MKVYPYMLSAVLLLLPLAGRAQIGNIVEEEDRYAEANRVVEEYFNLVNPDDPFHKAGNVLVVGEGERVRAISPYGGNADGGASYAHVVNRYAEKFPEVQVYCMPIPTPCAFYTPVEAEGYVRSEARVINSLFSYLSPDVKAVDVYTILGEHAAEEIYARTDHHWLPLGAYYAAKKFAAVAGLPFKGLETYEEKVVHNFVGTMSMYSRDPAIRNNPEEFIYHIPLEVDWKTTYVNYGLDSSRSVVVSESNAYEGQFFLKFPDGSAGAYCTFMGGDTKLTRVETTTPNGRKLLILKDSYGNALPGYLFYSFEEIHVIDCRYYTGAITEYIRHYGITDILFANNMEHMGMGKVVSNYNIYLDR